MHQVEPTMSQRKGTEVPVTDASFEIRLVMEVASVSATSPARQVAHFAIFSTKMGSTVQLALSCLILP